jgi:hypothetical protein
METREPTLITDLIGLPDLDASEKGPIQFFLTADALDSGLKI